MRPTDTDSAPLLERRRLLIRSWASSLPLLNGVAGMQPARANVVQSAPAKIALVIGNQTYRQSPLRSAGNDARAMSALLTDAGFKVDLRIDASLRQMAEAIEQLGSAAAGRAVGLSVFYFAGHAAQLDWRNYLLPVDGIVESARDIRKQCIDLGLLLEQLGRVKGKNSIIILDACRDDPFGHRFRAPQKGMSPYDAPAGTLLAFATAPGRVAIEPRGQDHGLYTRHLLRELAVRGVRVEDAFKRVRLNVRLASRGQQVPWESTSLESDVFLFQSRKPSEAELEQQLREELQTWDSIKHSKRLPDWTGFLQRFPNGRFSEAAQVRVRRMLAAVEPKAASNVGAAVPGASGGAGGLGTSAALPLRLGPGLPVPAALRRGRNPNSAGVFEFRPVWTPGDVYAFEERDLYSGVVQRRYTMTVRRVEAGGERVELGSGTLLNSMGAALREGRLRHFELPIEVNPAQLQVGRRWASRYRQSGSPTGEGEYDFVITGREPVSVPAGEFSAFKIEGTGWFSGPGTASRRTVLNRWLVPGINLPIRQEFRHFGAAHVMVSAKQAR